MLTPSPRRPYNSGTASARNTRTDPVRPGLPDPKLTALARPETFEAWWAWAQDQATAARNDPIKLHDRHRPPEPQSAETKEDGPLKRRLSKRRDQAIVGQPYSFPFERYLSGKPFGSPMSVAMARWWNPCGRGQQPQPLEFYILFALTNGHTDPEVVQAVVGSPRRDLFERAALNAFGILWGEGQKELFGAVDPPAPAGAA